MQLPTCLIVIIIFISHMIDIPNTPRIEDISEYSGENYIFVMLYRFWTSHIILASDPSMMAERGGFSRIGHFRGGFRVAFLGTFCAFLGSFCLSEKN